MCSGGGVVLQVMGLGQVEVSIDGSLVGPGEVLGVEDGKLAEAVKLTAGEVVGRGVIVMVTEGVGEMMIGVSVGCGSSRCP